MGERIQTLIKLVPAARRVVDVGADHGLVSMGLAKRGDIGAVLASDISADSLQKLRDSMAFLPPDVRAKLSLQVTDGLEDLLWDQADVLLIAGMGGPLMERILRRTPAFSRNTPVWVLSPHSGVADFRRFLHSMQVVVEEFLMEEEGIYYPMFRVYPKESVSEGDAYRGDIDAFGYTFGPDLLRRKDPVLHRQLKEETQRIRSLLHLLEDASGRSAALRKAELSQRLQRLEKVLRAWNW